jgi:hypothetical protein
MKDMAWISPGKQANVSDIAQQGTPYSATRKLSRKCRVRGEGSVTSFSAIGLTQTTMNIFLGHRGAYLANSGLLPHC